MNVRRWLRLHSLRILAIRDTPLAIAGGVGIGIFFGFLPLFGLKTISAIFFAWLTRSNIVAAAIACALHDVVFPLMPVVYLWEYDAGYYLLNHEWPHLTKLVWEGHPWRDWRTFFTVGKPLLLGSCVCAAPPAIVSFFVSHIVVARYQRRKQSRSANPPGAK